MTDFGCVLMSHLLYCTVERGECHVGISERSSKIRMKQHGPTLKLHILLLVFTVLFSGCQTPGSNTNILNHNTTAQGTDNDETVAGPETGYAAPIVEASGEEIAADSMEDEKESARAAIGLTEEGIRTRMATQEGKYAYDMLEESLRPLYVEILTIIEQHAENIKVSTNDSDVLQKVFLYVHADHPEIYWIDGYSYMRYSKGDDILYLTFSGKYTYTLEETRTLQIYIDQYVSRCLSGISMNASDYDKVKYIYEYIIDHTDYVLDSPDNQNILSVFLNGESVCQGYAKAAQYLLERLGVPCTMVVGKVVSGEGHAWNLVQIDGAYYYMDPTWGDASYRLDGQPMQGTSMPISYEFLNITTEQLQTTHIIDSVVPMPQCIATDANYYIRENLYFYDYDEEALRQVFQNAYADGREAVTIKCADSVVFARMQEELITNQKIFLFLSDQTQSVVYAVDDQLYTVSIWL